MSGMSGTKTVHTYSLLALPSFQSPGKFAPRPVSNGGLAPALVEDGGCLPAQRLGVLGLVGRLGPLGWLVFLVGCSLWGRQGRPRGQTLHCEKVEEVLGTCASGKQVLLDRTSIAASESIAACMLNPVHESQQKPRH